MPKKNAKKKKCSWCLPFKNACLVSHHHQKLHSHYWRTVHNRNNYHIKNRPWKHLQFEKLKRFLRPHQVVFQVYRNNIMEKRFNILVNPNGTYWGHVTTAFQVKPPCVIIAQRKDGTFFISNQRKIWTILGSKQTVANVILVNLTGSRFINIAAYAFHSIQWKHLQITIVLCQNFRNISFIFAKNYTRSVASAKMSILPEGAKTFWTLYWPPLCINVHTRAQQHCWRVSESGLFTIPLTL